MLFTIPIIIYGLSSPSILSISLDTPTSSSLAAFLFIALLIAFSSSMCVSLFCMYFLFSFELWAIRSIKSIVDQYNVFLPNVQYCLWTVTIFPWQSSILVFWILQFSFQVISFVKWNTNLMQHCAGFISAESLYMFRAQAPIIRSI